MTRAYTKSDKTSNIKQRLRNAQVACATHRVCQRRTTVRWPLWRPVTLRGFTQVRTSFCTCVPILVHRCYPGDRAGKSDQRGPYQLLIPEVRLPPWHSQWERQEVKILYATSQLGRSEFDYQKPPVPKTQHATSDIGLESI